MFTNCSDKIVQEDIKKAARLAERYFHTKTDSSQLRTNVSNFSWVYHNFHECLNILKDGEEVICVTLILPCTLVKMNDFLSGKTNERELFKSIKEKADYNNFESIYLCLACVKPKYRKQGLALKSFVDSIKHICRGRKVKLFFWAFSEEGRRLCTKVAMDVGMEVRCRS